MDFNFVRRKDQEDKDGRSFMYFQAIVNRRPVKFSLKKKLPNVKVIEAHWKGERGKWINNKHSSANRINYLLNQEYLAIERIILENEIKGKKLTVNELKFIYLKGTSNLSWDVVHLEYMKTQEELLKAGKKAARTLEMYDSRRNKVKQFDKYLTLDLLTLDWIKAYDKWMITELSNSLNTRYKSHEYVKAALSLAFDKKLINKNPYDDFPLKKETNTAVFLSFEEVKNLQELYTTTFFKKQYPGLNNLLRNFLVACFTGIDYSYTCVFDYADIKKINGNLCIDNNRAKKISGQDSGNPFVVPLNDEVKKYIDIEQKEGKVLRVISNQKTNTGLKKIAKMVGIQKQIKFHTARHTFATMSLNLGVSLEILQKWLGHKNIQQTQHYAKMLKSTASDAVTNWDNYGEKIK